MAPPYVSPTLASATDALPSSSGAITLVTPPLFPAQAASSSSGGGAGGTIVAAVIGIALTGAAVYFGYKWFSDTKSEEARVKEAELRAAKDAEQLAENATKEARDVELKAIREAEALKVKAAKEAQALKKQGKALKNEKKKKPASPGGGGGGIDPASIVSTAASIATSIF